MMNIRRAHERGHANHGWLDSHHTFSFANYYDPAHMGFRSLRVINEDRVAPGQGFGRHPHRDMEILSYPLAGAIEHRDSMGNGSVIQTGDVQRMSAGTGVSHSEYNPSTQDAAHFLQIWLLPRERDLPPSYEQKSFSEQEKRGRLRLIASPDGRDGSITVHTDAALYAGLFAAGETAELTVAAGRHLWVQITRGSVRVNGQLLRAGDGAALSSEPSLRVEGFDDGELLVFDLA